MKKILAVPGIVLLCIGSLPLSVMAEQTSASAYRAEDAIVVDGSLDEWKLDSPIVINDASQIIRDESCWLGETDLSVNAYLMWDEENLYFAADTKEASSFGAVGILGHDMEDNFKLYISTDPDLDPQRTAYDTNDFLLYLMMDNQNWYTAFDRSMVERENLARFTSQGMENNIQALEGYETAYSITESGFIFEAVIPWKNFSNDYIEQYIPAAGDRISFDLVVTDNDYPYPNTQASVQMSWCGGWEINKNPGLWGSVTFE